jgi:arginine/ornithine N-succinyltransferase beta subunit
MGGKQSTDRVRQQQQRGGTVMFTAPTQGGGDSVKVADLAGKLLIITPVEHKREITTVHGVTDAVEVNIVDLDGDETHNNILFFNIALKNALKDKIGQKVLARIGQGTAKAGKSAPWVLIDATGNPDDLAKANAFIGGGNAKASAPAAPQAPIDTNNLPPEVQALLNQLGAKTV